MKYQDTIQGSHLFFAEILERQVTQEKARGLGNDAKYASRDYPG